MRVEGVFGGGGGGGGACWGWGFCQRDLGMCCDLWLWHVAVMGPVQGGKYSLCVCVCRPPACVEFVQFFKRKKRKKKTSWETVTEVNEQFPLCHHEYSYQLNPALQIL